MGVAPYSWTSFLLCVLRFSSSDFHSEPHRGVLG